MSVGVTEIDSDHQQLFALFEQVRLMMRESRGGELLRPTLESLVEYTQSHFAREERWMREYHYVGLEAHVHQHRVLSERVEVLRKSFQGYNITVTALRMLQLLSRWLPDHIERTDQLLGDYLRTLERGTLR